MNSFQVNSLCDLIQTTYNSKEIIPLHAPTFIGNEKKYIEETIDSTFVSSVGKFVQEFEKKLQTSLELTMQLQHRVEQLLYI